ncbi:DUF7858 family protein [Halosegnis longus]|uniref:Uncharacterized protein n=2 Tax=Halosegnis longus TaxID=2216012 RepID=A0AAJ4UWQ2_9EURY|nr:hypothetical protein Nmn1133_11880 [Salella cibi]
MSLDDIAAGLAVTTTQSERGVAVADRTETPLVERLEPVADDLPCTPAAAATLVESYADGASIGDAARAANVAAVTAAKTLHLFGEDTSPLGPTGRDIVRDWLDARISRTDAKTLTKTDDDAFALAVYVETHDPLPVAETALDSLLAVEQADPLSDARSG